MQRRIERQARAGVVRLPQAQTLGLVISWSRFQAQPLRARFRRGGTSATVIVCDGKLLYARCGRWTGEAALEACAELQGPFEVERIDDARGWLSDPEPERGMGPRPAA